MKAESIQRRPGFYHVRLGFNWTIALYYQREGDPQPLWFIHETQVPFEESDFEMIGERVLPNGSASLRRKDMERMRRSNRLSWVCIVTCVIAMIIAIIEILTR